MCLPCRLPLLELRPLYRTVPLNILSIDENDKLVVNKAAVLRERQQFFPVDTYKLFKINAGTTGVCEWVYRSEGQLTYSSH